MQETVFHPGTTICHTSRAFTNYKQTSESSPRIRGRGRRKLALLTPESEEQQSSVRVPDGGQKWTCVRNPQVCLATGKENWLSDVRENDGNEISKLWCLK